MVIVMTKKKRYEYWEESDTAYDTKITYGQYFRIIDKKNMVYLLNEKEEEIQRLKAQLECGEDVCRICKHTYLVPSREYYIAQCKKGHSGCSKGTVDYCDDFELKDSDSKIQHVITGDIYDKNR